MTAKSARKTATTPRKNKRRHGSRARRKACASPSLTEVLKPILNRRRIVTVSGRRRLISTLGALMLVLIDMAIANVPGSRRTLFRFLAYGRRRRAGPLKVVFLDDESDATQTGVSAREEGRLG